MNNALSIAICEDMPEECAKLMDMILSLDEGAILSTFLNGESFLEVFEKGKYDIIFIDIFMGGMTGIKVAEMIRTNDKDTLIAFTTSSEDYTRESYRNNAYKYMLKPIAKEDVSETLKLAHAKRFARKQQSLNVHTKHGLVAIEYSDIYYVEVDNYTTTIHTIASNEEISLSIDALEKILPKDTFLRCHRSYIVNLEYIHGTDDRGDFYLCNGEKVLVRVRSKKVIKKIWEDYIFAKARKQMSTIST